MPTAQAVNLADPLARSYAASWERIVRQQESLVDNPRILLQRARLQNILRGIQADMESLNGQAREWVQSQIPKAYALGAKETGAALGGSFAWNQAHREAVEILANDAFDDLLKATKGVDDSAKRLIRQAVKSEALHNAIAGGTPAQGRRAVQKLLDKHGIYSVKYANGTKHGLKEYAQMALRTKSAVAHNVGAIAEGRLNGVEWWECFDGPECGYRGHNDPQRALGSIVTSADAFANPISHPNAVMEGTVITAALGKVRAVYRAMWSGPVFEIRTAGGSRLTIGPNHPVLTSRGWMKASELAEGDQVIRSTPQTVSVFGHSDLDQVEARVEDVFDAVRSVGSYSRVIPSPDDLHGDGNFCHDEVEIVGADSDLGPQGEATVNGSSEGSLMVADTKTQRLPSGSSLELAFVGVDVPASTAPSLLHIAGVGESGPDGDASLFEAIPESAVADARTLSDIFGRFSLDVSLDQIIEIRYVDSFVGHAYDLEVEGSSYVADGILVHNCRRSWGPRPDIHNRYQAANANRSVTFEQTDAQRAQDRARQQQQQRVAKRKRASTRPRRAKAKVAALKKVERVITKHKKKAQPPTARLAQESAPEWRKQVEAAREQLPADVTEWADDWEGTVPTNVDPYGPPAGYVEKAGPKTMAQEAAVRDAGHAIRMEVDRRLETDEVVRAVKGADVEIERITAQIEEIIDEGADDALDRIKVLQQEREIHYGIQKSAGYKLETTKRRVTLEVLEEVREMGRGDLDHSFEFEGAFDLLDLENAVYKGLEVFPREWIARSTADATDIIVEWSDRGVYAHNVRDSGRSFMRITNKDSPGSDVKGQRLATHEWGHRMEETNPHLKRMEAAFYNRRIGLDGPNPEKRVWLGDVKKNSGYEANEFTRLDDFTEPYMGKDYGAKRDSNYELLTMGMEYYFHSEKVDDDMIDFILGLLALG